MRYERKYQVASLALPAVEQVIRLHPQGFRSLYPPRWINNLYFDSPALDAFEDNVAGAPQRVKHRLRWYGRPFGQLKDPVLETKIKDNMLGWKRSQPLPSGLYEATDFLELAAACRELLGKGRELQPVLFNSYYRSYWGALACPFRITIDSQLQFGPYRDWAAPRLSYQDDAIIVEVKYDAKQEAKSDAILQHLPFRLSKSSKYVTGINLAYG